MRTPCDFVSSSANGSSLPSVPVGVPALAEAAADAASPCTDEGRAAAVATEEVGDKVAKEVSE